MKDPARVGPLTCLRIRLSRWRWGRWVGWTVCIIVGIVYLWVLAHILAVRGCESRAEGVEHVDPPTLLRPLFDALWQQEASGELEPEDGDGGKSIGPYQIQRDYWTDARMPDGEYEDCRKKPYAERVMVRYWKRYGAKTDEERARQHNGGPRGHKKKATLDYWKKVKANMVRDQPVRRREP